MKINDNLKNLKLVVSNLLAKPNVKIGINALNVLSDVLAVRQEKRSNWHMIKALSNGIVNFSEKIYIYPYDYFDHDWCSFLNDICVLVFDIVEKYPFIDIKSDEENCCIRIHDFEGYKIGYLRSSHTNSGSTPNMYVLNDHKEAAKKLIYDKLWQRFNSNNILMSINHNDKREEENTLKFSVDTSITYLGSEIAEEKIEYIKKCLALDIHRSILFYGPPGTGKSTIVKALVKALGLKSFRINLQDLNRRINITTVQDAIDIFQPEVLIIDDLDRSNMQDDLLNAIESFHKRFKLILVTANDISKFDPAMLRPERFDELFFIKCLDEKVVKEILGEELIHLFDTVHEWPVAFLKELKNRSRVLPLDKLSDSIEELQKRITINNDDVEPYSTDDNSDDKFDVNTNCVLDTLNN